MSDHAPLAPSASPRWLACPGSVRLCRELPDESSEAAEEGEFAHQLAAFALEDERASVADVGGPLVADSRFDVDAEMVEALDGYLAYVRDLRGEGKTERPMLIEEPVVVKPSLCYGTGDAIILPRRTDPAILVLDIVDLKFGKGVLVPAKFNPQLALYAIGAIRTARKMGWTGKTCLVRMHIYQPRHWQGGADCWSLELSELEDYYLTVIKPGIASTQQPDAPLVPGEQQCRFCPARKAAVCPALESEVMDLLPPQIQPGQVTESPPEPVNLVEQMTPDRLAQALQAFPLIEGWIQAVRDVAKRRAQEGETIPGFWLKQAVGHRTWTNPERVEALLSLMVPDPSVLRPGKLLSPAQAEKLLTKADRDLLSDFIETPVRGVALVPDSQAGEPAQDPTKLFDSTE